LQKDTSTSTWVQPNFSQKKDDASASNKTSTAKPKNLVAKVRDMDISVVKAAKAAPPAAPAKNATTAA
jgi:hypothetical protein